MFSSNCLFSKREKLEKLIPYKSTRVSQKPGPVGFSSLRLLGNLPLVILAGVDTEYDYMINNTWYINGNPTDLLR
jgi:hypothetical protein